MDNHRGNPGTPAELNSVLNEGDPGDLLIDWEQTDYWKGTGILLHFMQWSRPKILNAVRKLCRHLKEAAAKHQKQMI